MRFLKRLTGQREFVLFMVIVVMFIVMSFLSPYFLTAQNFRTLLLALSVNTIIAVGMTNLLVSGGFDISVGSLVAFVGIITGMLLKMGVAVEYAIAIALLVGATVGLFNGLLVAKVGINPFIVTLAGMRLLRGLTYIATKGQSQTLLSDRFTIIGQGTLLKIPLPIWYMAFFVIVGDILLRKSKFFRQNYYIGGNEKAARLSGIPVNRIKIINYIIMGVMTAIAGVVLASRLGSAVTAAGQGFEFTVITAVIIGGASLAGGEGTVFGTFLGSLLMVLVINILVLLGVSIYWQNFVVGATLLFAVLLDTLNVKRRERQASG